jgi:hypothetical protein
MSSIILQNPSMTSGGQSDGHNLWSMTSLLGDLQRTRHCSFLELCSLGRQTFSVQGQGVHTGGCVAQMGSVTMTQCCHGSGKAAHIMWANACVSVTGKLYLQLGVVVHICNPSTGEAEVERWGSLRPFWATQWDSYLRKPKPKTKQIKKNY